MFRLALSHTLRSDNATIKAMLKSFKTQLGILIVDSNISDTPSEEYKVDKNLSLFGRTWKEHETDTPTEDRMSALWSSLHNDSAFWLTERSLTNALLHAGFGHINKSLFPFHEWEHKCRDIWFAHHSRRKSQKIHFRVEPDERPVMHPDFYEDYLYS